MTSDGNFVIAGGGLGAAKAAQALREAGFEGPVVLIGAETELPYERPPLSKDYLLGKAERDSIFVHPQSWYAENNIDLRLGSAVTSIDRAEHLVTLADGSHVDYAKLLLATGSSPRRLPVPGATLDGVLTLRTVSDSERIKTGLRDGAQVVVIGGGWIGLETAAAARAAGAQVTVLEAADQPLLRVLGPEVAKVFADLHREHGVDLRCGVQVAEISGHDGTADGVQLADGTRIPADTIIAGVGITPNSQIAAAAHLAVDNGIRVDEQLRTDDPDIYAAGDVASAFHPLLGFHIRVEHWANALHQPQAAARAMLGQPVSYDRVPYFYTDQYDLGMEYSGYAMPGEYDKVVFRGDVAGREFVAFWLGRDGRVLAGMNVNVWDVTDAIQALVRSRKPVSAAALSDPDTPLEAEAGS
ncbi:MAG TPA: FAD-dependent oxidoreductase [Streptosporangiaceae bacterium]|nr:FAD-dependent oxidoreductase [Streptosporangiaceae bacterium]